MPNQKVKYFKSYEEIKEKVIYINDKDFLGFESANIFSFTFNLYKLKNFGVSKNFIYLEDDFFIGKSLTINLTYNIYSLNLFLNRKIINYIKSNNKDL
jgi:hypothetical protein